MKIAGNDRTEKMDSKKQVVKLFFLSVWMGGFALTTPLLLKSGELFLRSSEAVAEFATRLLICGMIPLSIAITILNSVLTCLAWRWEGRGDPKKGVKMLLFVAIGEFLILVLLPNLLGRLLLEF